jgi:peptidoglycan/LPS O-acetylase OafA/YrhL
VSIAYRPEIDGLRTISVFAVIIYHANFVLFGHNLFQGGFVGVDIFFVISGYLITSLILKEILKKNKFSYKYFYERRIRRILPVLLFIIIISSIISYFILLPAALKDFGRSILSIIFFSSNIYFWGTGGKYGDDSELIRPLLNTWSLSIEEQFYILFPIFLIIIIKSLRKYLLVILFLVFSFSLIFAQWSSITDVKINYNFFRFDINFFEKFNFYFLYSRIFEFLIGSILSYFELNTERGRKSYSKLNQILPCLGIILIVYSFLFFNFTKIFYPSVITLIPLIGVSLIIWFSKKGELITEILSNKIFVFFGLISYSLYLWHYPIFAFLRYIDVFNNSIWIKLLAILSTIILSIFSYFLIEKPFRNRNIIPVKTLTAYILLSVIISLSYVFYVQKTEGIQHRYNSLNYYNYKFDNLEPWKKSINFETSFNYDDYDIRKNVLIVGNSHAENLLSILSKTSLNNKIYFNLTSPKVRKEDYNYQIHYLYKFLTEKKAIIDYYNGDFFNHLNKQYIKSDVIILATQYSEIDLEILNKLIKLLKSDKKKIIIFSNALEQTMHNRFNRLDYYVFRYKKFPEKKDLKIIEQNMYKDLKNKELINLKIKNIAKKNNIPFVERERIFCDKIEKRCPSITDDGYKIYYDYGHITEDAAEFFARKIEKDDLFLKYLNSALQMLSN